MSIWACITVNLTTVAAEGVSVIVPNDAFCETTHMVGSNYRLADYYHHYYISLRRCKVGIVRSIAERVSTLDIMVRRCIVVWWRMLTVSWVDIRQYRPNISMSSNRTPSRWMFDAWWYHQQSSIHPPVGKCWHSTQDVETSTTCCHTRSWKNGYRQKHHWMSRSCDADDAIPDSIALQKQWKQ